MNERIKELAEQASDIVIEQAKIRNRVDWQEKFAELIIRECAKVAETYVKVENNKLVEKVEISAWSLQDTIKEHFGVE